MQFDWYQATIASHPSDVFSALEKAYPHTDLRPAKPANGYTHGGELVLGDSKLLRAMWGGVNGEAAVHCISSGSNSPRFADFTRKNFPDHQVSRADVAIDYNEKDSFKRLSKLLKDFAMGTRLKTAVAGDWIKGNQGRTLYLGGRTSSTYLRLYEKGKQLGMGANPDWTRCELEVKPSSKEGKAHLATLTPIELWGASRWSLKVAELLGHTDIARVPTGTVYTPSDDERALHYLIKQYGPLLDRVYHLCGDDWDLLGQYLGRLLKPEEFGLVDSKGKPVQSTLTEPTYRADIRQLDLF